MYKLDARSINTRHFRLQLYSAWRLGYAKTDIGKLSAIEFRLEALEEQVETYSIMMLSRAFFLTSYFFNVFSSSLWSLLRENDKIFARVPYSWRYRSFWVGQNHLRLPV